MKMRLKPIIGIISTLLLIACSDHDGGDSPQPVDGAAAISFAAGIGTEVSETRVYTGTIDKDDDLKEIVDGFGVFGYFTDGNMWSSVKTTAIADFMYNQSVYWGVQYLTQDGGGNDVPHYDWIYTPPKYWPNSTDNATPRRVSFFAYAPFTPEGAVTGITAFPNNTDKTQPYVQYILGNPNEQPDLLYASCIDATRNGQGLIQTETDPNTYQKVPLTFHHALACVDIFIQRLYDEETFEGKKPTLPDTTKLFVSELKLQETSASPKAIYHQGELSLETGVWSNLAGKTGTDADQTIIYGEQFFNDSIGGTNNLPTTDMKKSIIRDSELDKWEKENYGIDANERQLFKKQSLMFLPQELTLTPTLTYSMVTCDNELEHDYLTDSKDNRYFRILNTVEGTPIKLNLEQGKRYKLLIHVGVETILFEVISIEDWDFPLRFKPDVVPFEQDEKEKVVNED